MNLDQRWCDLTVRDYLVIERARGWVTGWLQLGLVSVVGYFIRKWYLARKARNTVSIAPALQQCWQGVYDEKDHGFLGPCTKPYGHDGPCIAYVKQ